MSVEQQLQVPYFRPQIDDGTIEDLGRILRSGWLTSGPQAKRFEEEFAAAVGGRHAIAVNSCTAALHLAVEALHLRAGDAVIVPTMTFAATAEIVRYLGAYPLLVDCDPFTTHMDLADAARKLERYRAGRAPGAPEGGKVVGMIPVHVGGYMMDIAALQAFADREGVWMIEDAAHSFPASWRPDARSPWQRCGNKTSAVSCFSFYANKTITTGEGGMVITEDQALADRMRIMCLHGLSHDAWGRYSGGGAWDYQIVAPGFKYNLTDIAATLGLHQLARAESMRLEREAIARAYDQRFADVEGLERPPLPADRVHAWHLYPIRLRLDRLKIDRNAFMVELKARGVGCSVHWRPLHLHPYYRDTFGWLSDDLPIATATWERLISLPIFPGMRDEETEHVIRTVRDLCARHAR